MKSIFALIAIVSFSLLAQAAPPKPVPGGNGGPQPIPSQKKLSYEELKKMWENGRATNEEVLVGKWERSVGKNAAACIWDSKPDGGSAKSALEFKYEKIDGEDFSGTPAKYVLAVRILNIYGNPSLAQGPYQVDPNEPQYSMWLYEGLPGEMNITNRVYSEESCRLVNGTNNKLICAGRLRIVNLSGINNASDVRACAALEYSSFSGYTKQ